jgi:hypothetical protein
MTCGADQRAGRDQGEGEAARLAGRELGTERGGDLAGVTELGRRGRGGLARGMAGRAVGGARVEEPAAQFGALLRCAIPGQP